jgi:hypothetical protein
MEAKPLTYTDGWRNRIHQLYTQYCDPDQCPRQLLKILLEHGSAFDDYWFYAIRGRSRKVVIRRPLWMTTEESGRFAEKYKKPAAAPRCNLGKYMVAST